MITIVDYGLGNRGSVLNVLKRLGIPGRISGNPEEIATSERLILPGVGSFDAGMRKLNERGLVEPLKFAAGQGSVMLGICLGMQLMCEGSEEGSLPGLALVKGSCLRFDPSKSALPIKIPHMGWSNVDIIKQGGLFRGADRPRFYFVHSYHVVCSDSENIAAQADHGQPFTAAFECGSLYGVQFHPEKSHGYGMNLIRNFAEEACARV